MAMNENFFLVVRVHVAPQVEAQLLGGLDGGHMKEVASQPGFLGGKRIRIDRNAEGWSGFWMIYGVRSKADFDLYEKNTAPQRWSRSPIISRPAAPGRCVRNPSPCTGAGAPTCGRRASPTKRANCSPSPSRRR